MGPVASSLVISYGRCLYRFPFCRLVHFPVSEWLSKHRAIEDDLLRQLSEKDTQIELLTEENSLLEKDFEQLRKDYQDLQRSHDER